MFDGLVSLIGNAVRIGMNLTDTQRQYMEWRLSDEGKKYFSQDEENGFYTALAGGHVDIVEVAIHEKQEKIEKLKRELGIS